MNNRNDWFEDLQRNVSELIAKSPAGDIERNVRAMMSQTFSRLDLITREEFDTQKELLERAMVRITALESRVQALEGIEVPPQPAIDTPPAMPSDIPPAGPTDIPPRTPSDVPPQTPKL